MMYITKFSNYKNLEPNTVPIFATFGQGAPYGSIRIDELAPDEMIVSEWYIDKDTEKFIKEYKNNILLPLNQTIIMKRIWSNINYDIEKPQCIIVDDDYGDIIIDILVKWFADMGYKLSIINITEVK